MRESTTWVLVCDAARARLFQGNGSGYAMIAELSNPRGRAHVRRDLVTDANGRKPSGHTRGASKQRPGAAPDTDPKEVEAEKFARQLAAGLERGVQAHAYEELVLVAPPGFLGELQQALGDQVRKRVHHTVSKDLSGLAPREIAARLEHAAA